MFPQALSASASPKSKQHGYISKQFVGEIGLN